MPINRTPEENVRPGQKIRRGIDGKIEGGSLSPELASEMGRMKNKVVRETRIEQLLQDRGLDPSACDEGLRTLAGIAVSARSGSVSALRYLDLLSGYAKPGAEGGPVAVGEMCPVCHQVKLSPISHQLSRELCRILTKDEDTENPSANAPENTEKP